jgi:hypothetical protein
LHIDTYKAAEKEAYPAGNNHGSAIEIDGRFYIFYHRQTNGTWFSRQGCMEQIEIDENGAIKQAQMTSCGGNGGPLRSKGEYPAYIACNLYLPGLSKANAPKITQDGRDGDEEAGFVSNITDNTVIGFKYFDCKGIKKVTVKTRGYGRGVFELKTSPDAEPLGKIAVENANIWTEFSENIDVPDGVNAVYFVYKGGGNPSLASFCFD